MRIATFNMQHGLPTRAPREGGAGTRNVDPAQPKSENSLNALAASVRPLRLDVLLLQEVDHRQRRSERVPQWKLLADELGMRFARFAPFYYGPAAGPHLTAGRTVAGVDSDAPLAQPHPWAHALVDSTGLLRLPAFGVATLSRMPIDAWESIPLGGPLPLVERRAAARGLSAMRVLDNNRTALLTSIAGILVANTHLVSSAPEARQQLDTLMTALGKRRGPVLLGGDLNLEPSQLPTSAHPLISGLTFPARRPLRQLDHLLAVGPRWATPETNSAWRHAPAAIRPSHPVPASDGGVVALGYSDHRLLWADV